MKRKGRIKRFFHRFLLSIFCIGCFLLLSFLLYASQILSIFMLYHDDAMVELEHIQSNLVSQAHHEELEETMEYLYRYSLQQIALLITNQELSDELLAAVLERQDFASSVMIFHEDGTPLYASGDVIEDPDFLCRLREGGQEKAESGFTYRAVPFQDNLYLAVGFSADFMDMNYRKTQHDMDLVAELAPGMSNEIMVVGRYTQRTLYGPQSTLGKKLNEFRMMSLDDEADEELFLYIMVIDDEIELAFCLEHQDYLLLSLISLSDVIHSMNTAIAPALLGFGFLIFFMLIYVRFIHTDMRLGRLGKIHYIQLGKKRYLNTLLLRKLVGFALIGISCMTCIVYCLQLLIRSDEQRQNAENRMNIAVRVLEESQANMAEIEKQDMELLVDTAKDVRSMLSFNPELLSEEGLNSVARLFNCEDIYVLDDAGKTLHTNADEPTDSQTELQPFALSNNNADSTYPFWNVINGFAESHVQVVRSDPYSGGNDMLYAGLASEDGRGMLMLTFSYNAFSQLHQMYNVDTVLSMVGLDSMSTLLAVNSGSDTCIFDSSNRYTGMPLYNYGIKETFLRNGYSGTHQFDGKNCLITTRTVLDWNLIYITPTSLISTNSRIFTALVIVIGLLVVIVTVLPWLVVRTPGDDIRRPVRKEKESSHRSHVDAVLTRDGQIELIENKVEHHTLNKQWYRMIASAKLSYLVRGLMVCTGFCLLFFLQFNRHTGDYPLMDYILEQNWDRSLNVYAFSYVIIAVIGISAAAKIMQAITLFVTSTFSRRWKTLGILISNIIRYAALIASIFVTLQNFGVETSTLVTSASVLTLVFGLGCQSFVADMVAGVFLIFEGTFRVGDIVTIDGWHGEVVEIGLRATKVKNEIGNIKVFQNSRISGAINMTRDLTYAVCDIMLPAGQPLEEYENKLITSFFPAARESILSIRHPLVYEGVVAMNGDNATLRISVKCLESEREQIKRDLYRALKLWRERG